MEYGGGADMRFIKEKKARDFESFVIETQKLSDDFIKKNFKFCVE